MKNKKQITIIFLCILCFFLYNKGFNQAINLSNYKILAIDSKGEKLVIGDPINLWNIRSRIWDDNEGFLYYDSINESNFIVYDLVLNKICSKFKLVGRFNAPPAFINDSILLLAVTELNKYGSLHLFNFKANKLLDTYKFSNANKLKYKNEFLDLSFLKHSPNQFMFGSDAGVRGETKQIIYGI